MFNRRVAGFVLVMSAWAAGDAAALDDPMRPPSWTPAATGGKNAPVPAQDSFSYALSSTFISQDTRLAVVNGQTVRVGDRVGEARVAAILPTQVTLQKNGKEIVVRLVSADVKRPARTAKQE